MLFGGACLMYQIYGGWVEYSLVFKAIAAKIGY
jgi:hypothetical protein